MRLRCQRSHSFISLKPRTPIPSALPIARLIKPVLTVPLNGIFRAHFKNPKRGRPSFTKKAFATVLPLVPQGPKALRKSWGQRAVTLAAPLVWNLTRSRPWRLITGRIIRPVKCASSSAEVARTSKHGRLVLPRIIQALGVCLKPKGRAAGRDCGRQLHPVSTGLQARRTRMRRAPMSPG